jgi:hypothetical protein
MEGYSLMIFSVKNPIRMYAYRLIHLKLFEYLILIVINISTIQLAIDNPLNDPAGILEQNLYKIDIITTAIFAFEIGLKIVCFGFVLNGR